ncbi:MAG: HAMP domain-containing sensor histidine kinase [Slackia sp.]|nr:HAMP domain-containing sensor histidine kinase [Slackia sp.]
MAELERLQSEEGALDVRLPQDGAACSSCGCEKGESDECMGAQGRHGDDAGGKDRTFAAVMRGVLAWLRHPVKSTRTYLDTCPVRSAFFFYALIGMAAAFTLSLCAVSLLNAAAEEILYRDRSAYPGLYLYDEAQNALVPAEDISWYENIGKPLQEERADATSVQDVQGVISTSGSSQNAVQPSSFLQEGVSLYVAERPKDSPYYTAIPLDDVPEEAQDAVLHDIDESRYREGEETSISLQDVASYDERTNAQRGDAQSLRESLPANTDGERPAVSLVGYYVYFPVTWLYQVVNLAVFGSVPAIFVACLLAVSRGFYRRKLQRPIQAMDDAARRIAEGDLSVPVAMPPEGSRSELDRLCASFESMRDALERNNKVMWRVAENRRKVNAAFAHDLRTPLTVLKGRAEMLSTFAPAGLVDAEQLAEASDAMVRQTERLQRYVESMKDLADLDECVVAPHEGDVGAWFVRAAAEASDLVRGAGIDFEAKAGGLPRCASFDDVALSRVVENALSNALRYARSKVGLLCSWDEGMLTVRVVDDGPGFDAAALEHGCEPFWRDADEKRREDSAHFGLGLNICAELCEKHGGGVRLSNEETGGAVVEAFVRAPLA